MELTKEQTKLCNKKLEIKDILVKPGMGNKVYVSGTYIKNKLNEIFGVGGWGYTSELNSIYGPTDKSDKALLGYMARVTLTIGDLIISDVGTGEITFSKNDTFKIPKMDQIDKARKGSVTDGVKRCAVNLGSAFGLNIVKDAKDYGIIKNE